jgi:hypothetical protein
MVGLRRAGITPTPAADDGLATGDDLGCPLLGWAASGAMSLTGRPGEPPQWPDGDVVGRLTGAAHLLAVTAGDFGADLVLEVGELLTGRAVAAAGATQGVRSMGGHCQLVRTADSWVAINLARPGDLELLPALTDGEVAGSDGGDPAEPWEAIRSFAGHRLASELTAKAQLLGIPAGALGTASSGRELPWTIHQWGEAVGPGPRRPLVVDFSALWSGPLCAHLLGRCGARVVKVEDVGRPDGARQGDPSLFEHLHRGHEQLALDFRSATGGRALRTLFDSADVVIEASRPRALAALGFSPAQFLRARAGRTWVSITGYGRSGPRSNWVAFGDDAAVAGGLVAWRDARGPVFCADAIADPITGLCAAVGALGSIAHGGGHLVDCSMRASSAFANRAATCHGEHRVERRGSTWFACHGEVSRPVEPPRSPGPDGWTTPG